MALGKLQRWHRAVVIRQMPKFQTWAPVPPHFLGHGGPGALDLLVLMRCIRGGPRIEITEPIGVRPTAVTAAVEKTLKIARA